jgi:hypothetical protein
MVSEELKEFKEFRSSGVQEFNGRVGKRSDWIASKDDSLEWFAFARSRLSAIGQAMNFEFFGHGLEMPGS